MNLALRSSLTLALVSLSPLTAQSFFGSACVDSLGGLPAIDYPTNAWIRNPSVDESVLLRDAVPGTSAFLLVGASPANALDADLGIIGGTDCSLYVNPFATAATMVGADGSASFSFGPVGFGPEFVFQWVVLDPAAPRALTLETTERMTVGVPAQTSVFRINSLQLRDPHIFVSGAFGLCLDVTENVLGLGGINPTLDDALGLDGDGDGLLDANLMMGFRPLDISAGVSGTVELSVPSCTAPAASTVCTLPPFSLGRAAFTNSTVAGAPCLAPVPGTTSSYSPGIAVPSAPCFSTAAASLNVDFLGLQVPLSDVRVGGRYVGSPVTDIADGLLYGFVPEALADAITVPTAVPLIGGSPLSSAIRGGVGNCATGSDLDVGSDGVTPGWWFYFNFSATAVALAP